MPSLWLPGAAIVHADLDGGSMLGGGAFMTWHTFEVDADDITAVRGAQILNAQNTQVTFVVDPVDGDVAQMIPPTRASRGLANLSGGVQTNRAGRLHIQCEVIARAGKPFTKYWTPKGKAAVLRVSAFAKSWGVPNLWPAGPTLGSYGARHRRIAPGPSGHYGHSQWRENSHWDPGTVNTAALLVPNAPASPLPNLPKPKPTAKPDRARTKTLQRMLELAGVDGLWGSSTDSAFLRIRAVAHAGSSKNVAWVQRVVDVTPDGDRGPKTNAAIKKWVAVLQKLVGVTADGVWGAKTDTAVMAFRKANLNRF